MKKLEQETFTVAQAILNELSSVHVAIASILDGSISGELWVDNVVSPQFVIVANGDAFYLAGTLNVPQETLSAVKEIIPDWAYLFVDAPLVPHLAKLWNNQLFVPHSRIRMGYQAGETLTDLCSIPDKFEIVPVNKALFDRNPGNLDALAEKIETWSSPEAFFESAIGYCVLFDNRIVSHSITDSISGSRCEIGVETDYEFRRQKLGCAVAGRVVAECLRRGIHDVEWHSHASNIGSQAIAKALGMTELDRHVAYSASLPAENIGDLSDTDCHMLAAHFERASQQIGWCRFHAAGAYALIGDRENALKHTRLLIESGWEGEAEWLQEFWALRSLRDDPEFISLLETMVE